MGKVLLAVAFLAALVAVIVGLRRVRPVERLGGRGPFGALRRAFWTAAATLLGVSAGCGDGTEADRRNPGGGGAGWDYPDYTCYRDPGSLDDGWTSREDTDDAGDRTDDTWSCYLPEEPWEPDPDGDAESPDADEEPDGVGDVAEPDAEEPEVDEPEAEEPADADDEADVDVRTGDGGPRTANLDRPAADGATKRRARRLLLRADAVARLLSDPATHPVVREILRRDAGALRRQAARLRAATAKARRVA